MKRKKFIIIALTITIAVLATSFFFLKPFIVVGQSMFPAFVADERLVVETFSKHFLKIKRGEAIVFREPHERKEIFVKRVVGLPNETVRLTDNSVTIISPNGATETFGEDTLIGGRKNGDPMEMKLGPEDYFVMGDNREKSTDSRHFGTVQPADIVGRPILRGFAAKIFFPLLTLGGKTPPQAEGAYTIGSSLRFNDDDSAYLSRTPGSAGNRKTWTYSLWLKRGSLSSINYILAAFSPNRTAIRFNATNSLLFTFESGLYDVETNALFRDPSAYLHLIVAFDTTQATASDRVKFYINGSQVTSFSTANYPAQNYEGDFNNNVIQKVGADLTTTFDGLMSEINFIDGQALTPSSFGLTDGNGYWRPKAYSGTYGTNGFYLPFNDGTNTTTLGYDRSGNGNNYTLTNLATTDQMTDTPTNTYSTLNPLGTGIPSFSGGVSRTLSDGNLSVAWGTGSYFGVISTIILPPSGKWYWEVTHTSATVSDGISVGADYGGATEVNLRVDNTNIYSNGSAVQSGLSGLTTNDIIGLAWDAGAGSMQFYKNGAAYGSPQSYTLSAGAYSPFVMNAQSSVAQSCNVNFGQRPFAYTPPTGFKALNTANLPEPTIVQPNKYFTTVIYAGTGATQSITGTPTIVTFTSSQTWTVPAGVTSVDYLVVGGGGGGAGGGPSGGGGAGGFRTASGFSVIPGTNVTVTVGGGGGGGAGAPSGAAGTAGTQGSDSIFSTIIAAGGGGGAASTTPYIGGSGGSGGGGGGSNPPFTGGAGNSPNTSPSQGNNGGDGGGIFGGGGGGGAGAVGANSPNCCSGGNGGAGTASTISGSSVTYAGGGGGGAYVAAGGNSAGSGGAGGGGAGVLGYGSNGVAGTANTGGGGGGGGVGNPASNYAASAGGAGGSGIVIIRYVLPAQAINFQPDLVWLKDRTSANAHGLFDSIRTATKYLSSNSTAAETTDTNSLSAFLSNGFSVGTTGLFNTSGNSYISWNWKESPISGFDIVSYTGNGVAGRTVAHSLGIAPKMIIVKERDGVGAWDVYHEAVGNTYALFLNTTDVKNLDAGYWNNTSPSLSVFTLGIGTDVNENTKSYIAYLFAEKDGFSKFGSYTGNGSADGPFVWTGFKPKFVMIKRTDSTGGWLVYDIARQTYNVNDNCLQPADTAVEANPCGNAIDVLSNGFKSRSTGTSANASGSTYIYAAFAETPFKYSSASDSTASGAVFTLGMSF